MASLLAQHGWQIAGMFAWQVTECNGATFPPGHLDSAIDEAALFAGRHHGNLQDSRDYLAWEEELPGQIDTPILQQWHRMLAG